MRVNLHSIWFITAEAKWVYQVLKINASREMERNWPIAALLAATDPAWLVFIFPPFSGRRFVYWPGTETQLQILDQQKLVHDHTGHPVP